MNTMQAAWVDAMGVESTIITIEVEPDIGRVLVTRDTQREMVRGALTGGAAIVGEEAAIGLAIAVLDAPTTPDGFVDVTEVGGGFGQWMETAWEEQA